MTVPLTFVYFLRPVGLLGPIKVGCSLGPKTRLEDMLTWSPFKLEIIATTPGTLKDESFLHQCFAESHSHREWFNPSVEIQQALTIILGGGGMADLRAALKIKGSIRKKAARFYSENWRLYRSYQFRVMWAQRRLRATGIEAWDAPADVKRIISAWNFRDPTIPERSKIDRLDEYLANPAAHSVVPTWMRRAAA